MPKGQYPRDHIAESARAKARGVTGFMHHPRKWEVHVSLPGHPELYRSHLKLTRDASRDYERMKKAANDDTTRFYGATVHLLCDGVEIRSNKA